MQDIIKRNVHPTDPEKQVTLIIYYKSRKTSHLLLRNRPTTNKTPLQEDHVIYRHTCTNVDCGPLSYIGMTTTKLSRRLSLHLQNGTIKSHYIAPHHQDLSRSDLDLHTTILDREQDRRRLALLEAIHIQTLKPSLNIQTDDFQTLPSARRAHNLATHLPAPSAPPSAPTANTVTPRHNYHLRSSTSRPTYHNHAAPPLAPLPA